MNDIAVLPMPTRLGDMLEDVFVELETFEPYSVWSKIVGGVRDFFRGMADGIGTEDPPSP